jgi:cysteinyl-tRNA synthetase
LARIDECLAKLRELAGNTAAQPDAALLEKFSHALDNDLNISGAWGAIFEWVRESNRLISTNQMSAEKAASALAGWNKINSVLGLSVAGAAEIPAELTALLDERNAARKAKDFKRADAIRDELKTKGWGIEDTPKGARLKKI